jgi:hypothetical protein
VSLLIVTVRLRKVRMLLLPSASLLLWPGCFMINCVLLVVRRAARATYLDLYRKFIISIEHQGLRRHSRKRLLRACASFTQLFGWLLTRCRVDLPCGWLFAGQLVSRTGLIAIGEFVVSCSKVCVVARLCCLRGLLPLAISLRAALICSVRGPLARRRSTS